MCVKHSHRLWRGALVVSAILSAACVAAVRQARPSPFPMAPAPGVFAGGSSHQTPTFVLVDVVRTALGYLGVRYHLGGDSPQTGFDCSGFVRYVFAISNQVDVPRTVSEQYRVGTTIRERDIHAGDLVFFSTADQGPSHVGIALDRNEFVHAPGANGSVRVEHL